jgi:hypothetical protein
MTGIAPALAIKTPGIRLLGDLQGADVSRGFTRRTGMKSCGAVFPFISFAAKNMLLIDRWICGRPV